MLKGRKGWDTGVPDHLKSLRMRENHGKGLEALLLESLESGGETAVNREFWSGIKKEAAQIRATQERGRRLKTR